MKIKLMITLMVFLLIFSFAACKKGSSAKEDTANLKEFSGYLMDVTCGTSGVGLDKTDVKKSPQDHTVACLQVCEASGYGIMIYDSNLGFYKFSKFDDKGNELAKELLKNTKKEKGIEIDITGSWGEDNIIVHSMKEK